MSPASIQTPMFISYCSPVQGRRTHSSTGVHKFYSVVIGQHIYKCVWTPLTDKSVSTTMQEGNKHDEHTVNAISKRKMHISRDIENALIFLNK